MKTTVTMSQKIYIDPQGKKFGINAGQDDLIKDDWSLCLRKDDGEYAENYNIDGTIAPDSDPTVEQVQSESSRRQGLICPSNKLRAYTAKYNSLVKRSGSLTPEQDAEKDALDNMWDAIGLLADKAETISEMSPIPQDFTNDSYWS